MRERVLFGLMALALVGLGATLMGAGVDRLGAAIGQAVEYADCRSLEEAAMPLN